MHVALWSLWLDAAIAGTALAVAVAVRPWRALPAGGPPWPWMAWWAVLPVLWGVDGPQGNPIAQPMSGASLLTLMAGWPLAVLAMLPAALMAGWWAGLPWDAVLQRGVWLGVVPATLAMALGAALRRWLPNHLFIYILGRGFFATTVAGALAALGQMLLHPAPGGLDADDLLLARVLTASGDAFITGMLVSICVAFRPHWLATYADRIYLPPKPAA
jgi:uncharacterized membrane protein